MPPRVTFRVDRGLPEGLARSPGANQNVAIDLFDAGRLAEVLAALDALGAAMVSAIGVELDQLFVDRRPEPDPNWVAAVVASDNHGWLADPTYTWPYDWAGQRVAPGQPLRVYTTPRGAFSRLGLQFAARASFRRFVESMPESFEYTTGEVIRKGTVLDGWSRVEPVREVTVLASDSLGAVSTTFHPQPFQSHLLWMGTRTEGDFGFVWDRLPHGWFGQERCALVPVGTARALAARFPGDFLGWPVFDVESATARRAVEVYRTIRDRLPMHGWAASAVTPDGRGG